LSSAALPKTQGHTRLKPMLHGQMRHRVASVCFLLTRVCQQVSTSLP
jgi:hypothetical protein